MDPANFLPHFSKTDKYRLCLFISISIRPDENIPSMDESPEINLPINYTGKNAITSVIMTKESKDLESIHITSDNSLTNIQYFDGLGRIIQNIEKNISPSGSGFNLHHRIRQYGKCGQRMG